MIRLLDERILVYAAGAKPRLVGLAVIRPRLLDRDALDSRPNWSAAN